MFDVLRRVIRAGRGLFDIGETLLARLWLDLLDGVLRNGAAQSDDNGQQSAVGGISGRPAGVHVRGRL